MPNIKNFRVVSIQKDTEIQVIVSDELETTRDGFEENEAFRQEAEEFLQERYGEHLQILSSLLAHQGDYSGCAWIRVSIRTDGIIEDISNDFGITVSQ